MPKTEPAQENLRQAVSNGQQMLAHGAFKEALEQAKEIQKIHPNEPNSLLIKAIALRELGMQGEALGLITSLCDERPDFALAQHELGVTLYRQQDITGAIASLSRAVKLEASLNPAWNLLHELYLAINEPEKAQEAQNHVLMNSTRHPMLVEAVDAFGQKKMAIAERLCRNYLQEFPDDVSAMRLLADVGIQRGSYDDAEELLARCLELAPDFNLARHNYAHALSRREKFDEALHQISILEHKAPGQLSHQTLKASIFARKGDMQEALILYANLVQKIQNQPSLYTSYGHALRTAGQQSQAIDVYRKAIDIDPKFGEAYWNLADLKTFRFTDQDIEAMETALHDTTVELTHRFHLHFAVGKALEDRQEYRRSFGHYQLGNEVKRRIERYDADETSSNADRNIATCTQEFFAARKDWGEVEPAPIFIVGLPRSGSTLLEQILASHSQVDGTKELIYIIAMARQMSERHNKKSPSKYPQALLDLSQEQVIALGKKYLAQAAGQRGDAPFFIDKMPNNFQHIGLIQLILPNAKIIDARRHPAAACFSGFKQLFAQGQSFTYGLSDIGRYYSDYVRLMDHWHTVQPGKILQVNYEEVVVDLETQVRRILDFCQLPFEENCIEFHRNERAVRTASSEQVRQPIYRSGLEAWRPFDSYLGPLKDAVGELWETPR
ncbi:MAG: sulfotransferase [Pseudomonadales bacterium]